VAKSSKSDSKYVSLRSVADGGVINPSSLKGSIDGTEVNITTILINTAVYTMGGDEGKKYLESLEKIMVNKDDIFYLPVKESTHPGQKKK